MEKAGLEAIEDTLEHIEVIAQDLLQVKEFLLKNKE